MDNQQIARSILAAVGPENITEAYNCMTRLRLRVSAVTVTKEQLKKIAGVKGVILNDGEIHVVLGPGKAENVAKECKRLLAEQEKTKAAAQTVGAEPAALSASHSVSENPKPDVAAGGAYLYSADPCFHRLWSAYRTCQPVAEDQS